MAGESAMNFDFLQQREVAPFEVPDVEQDEPTIERGYNRTLHSPAIATLIEQAYPGIRTDRTVQAEHALDVRKAGNLPTIVEPTTDPRLVEHAYGHFVSELSEKLPTGEINLPGASAPETVAVVARILMDEAMTLERPAHPAETARLAALQKKYDDVMAIVTPDQLETRQRLAEAEAALADMERQRDEALRQAVMSREIIAIKDRIIARQTVEGLRAGINRVRHFGGAVVAVARGGAQIRLGQ